MQFKLLERDMLVLRDSSITWFPRSTYVKEPTLLCLHFRLQEFSIPLGECEIFP